MISPAGEGVLAVRDHEGIGGQRVVAARNHHVILRNSHVSVGDIIDFDQANVLADGDIKGMKTNSGDHLAVVISATFRPSFAWWHKTVKQRFVTVRSQDGAFGWIEQPLEQD